MWRALAAVHGAVYLCPRARGAAGRAGAAMTFLVPAGFGRSWRAACSRIFDWHMLDQTLVTGPVRLIGPSLVVEELDELKRDRDGGRRLKARQSLQALWRLHEGIPNRPAALPESPKVCRGVPRRRMACTAPEQRRRDHRSGRVRRAVERSACDPGIQGLRTALPGCGGWIESCVDAKAGRRLGRSP